MYKLLIITSFLIITNTVFGQSIDKIRVGDHVIDQWNYTGTVKEINSNGSTKVKLDSFLGKLGLADRALSELSKKTKCAQNACIGDRVLDIISNQAGTIEAVYSNCQLKVRFDGMIGKMGLADRTCKDLGY